MFKFGVLCYVVVCIRIVLMSISVSVAICVVYVQDGWVGGFPFYLVSSLWSSPARRPTLVFIGIGLTNTLVD